MRALTLLPLLLALATCKNSSNTQPSIIATTTQLADVAQKINDDAINIHQILQPNTDPHKYEPQPTNVQTTANTRLVLTSNDELNAWIGEIAQQTNKHARMLTVAPTHVRLRHPNNPH